MKMPLRILTASLAVILTFIAIWKPWVDDPPRNTIRVVMLKYLSYSPIFIAQEEGFFAAEGLEVELLPVSRISAAIPSLIQGEIDVLPVAIMPAFFNIINRGGTMKVVGGKGYISSEGCAYSGIMARRNLIESGELSTAADMAGRRISTDRTSPSYFRFNRFIESAGLTLDDLTVIDLPAAARIDAFASGALDVSTASEPWVTRYRRAGDSLMWSRSSDHLPGFQFGYLLFGKTLLEDRPQAGERFMLAYLKAVRHLNEEGKSDRHIEILEKHTGLDRELLKEACWPPLRNDGRAQEQSLAEFQTWALEQGLISRITPVDLVYDSRFIEHANRMLPETAERR
jgi:NitT/TauT family transport system substrate-binding protein